MSTRNINPSTFQVSTAEVFQFGFRYSNDHEHQVKKKEECWVANLPQHMSHVVRKPVLPYANNKGADQPAHPPSLIQNFKTLASFYRWASRFESYLVANPEDKFSYDEDHTIMFLSFRTDMSGQTVQTQIRLLLREQSDQGLHCLLFHLHRLDSLLYSRAT